MESKGLEVCKYLMFVFNLLVFLSGIVLLGVGIWGYVNSNSFKELVSSEPALINSTILMMAIGVVLIIAGFFGCAGAIRESKCLLGTFFTIILILFIVEVVAVILVFVYMPRAKEIALNSMNSYNTTKVAWDAFQSTFTCCGVNNSSDWGVNLPSSCCHNTTACSYASPSLYRKGCEKVLLEYTWVLGGVGIGILLFELLAMISTCCLFHGVDKYETA